MNTVLSMVEAIGSGIVKGGLIGVELKNDGSFGAQYKDLIVEGTDVSAILGALLNPKFGEEVKSFPNAETSEILPEAAIGYYTKDSKLYFKIGRDFLKAAGRSRPRRSRIDRRTADAVSLAGYRIGR